MLLTEVKSRLYILLYSNAQFVWNKQKYTTTNQEGTFVDSKKIVVGVNSKPMLSVNLQVQIKKIRPWAAQDI